MIGMTINKKVLLKIVSLTGSVITAVATIMLADCDSKEMETKVFNDVMDNVTTMLKETKEVL